MTSIGDFDPTKGGHLVLWDCKLVIEFPPGSTILIPSAVITHSNVPVAPHKKHFSFTQYTAGVLFRWVDNDFQTAVSYAQSLSEEEQEDRNVANQKRWEFGLSLLPRVPFVRNHG